MRRATMKLNGRPILFVGLLGWAMLATPANVAAQEGPAQNCARCEDCQKCGPSAWGGAFCHFKNGCCQEDGGNCNPALALNVDTEDRRVVSTDDGGLLVVRLSGNTFGTWGCDGVLRAAFRETAPGALVPVSASDFTNYKRRYTLGEYVNTLGKQILAEAG